MRQTAAPPESPLAGSVTPSPATPKSSAGTRVSIAIVGIALGWAYWAPVLECVRRWGTDPAYSHGYLVPLFSLFLLWRRRGILRDGTAQGSWWGIVLLAVGAALLLASAYWYYALLAAYALLPSLAGAILLLGGWSRLRWAWPAVFFLFFMVPLPGQAADLLAHPLQRVATKVSTYAVQVLGIPAFSEGNVIVLSEARIGVVEACSGLWMLVLFIALATGMALVIERKTWEKVLLVLSAIPIAVAANVIRITVTAALHEWVGSKIADLVFHDLAGWLMMPLALTLLWVELALLSRLLIAPVESRPVTLEAAATSPTPRQRAAAQAPDGRRAKQRAPRRS